MDEIFQGEEVSLLLADFYEEILMGGLIGGSQFHPTHYVW